MRIKCWGARGSIPVSGPSFLKYGGDTACIEIHTQNDEIIIIDAGTGIRALGDQLIRENQKHIHLLFTHTHLDHIMGFPYFQPIYNRQSQIDIYGSKFGQQSLQSTLSKLMEPPFHPAELDKLQSRLQFHDLEHSTMQIGSVVISYIRLNHPNGGLGFKFQEDDQTFVFLTDNELHEQHEEGLAFKTYVEFCREADLLFHDAEFTDEEYTRVRSWGHSTVKDALHLAMEAGVKRFGLFHHNRNRSDAALDGLIHDCQQTIKSNQLPLSCFAVATGMEFLLENATKG